MIVFILVANIELCIYIKPFLSEKMNRMELLSLITSFFNVMLGLYFLEPNSSTNGTIKLTIFIIVILVNTGFLAIWIFLFGALYFAYFKKII